MKLIIDIPKSIYEYMQTDKYDRHKTEYFEMIIPHSVKDGTPLEEELEKIRAKINSKDIDCLYEEDFAYSYGLHEAIQIIDDRISELKGENNV